MQAKSFNNMSALIILTAFPDANTKLLCSRLIECLACRLRLISCDSFEKPWLALRAKYILTFTPP